MPTSGRPAFLRLPIVGSQTRPELTPNSRSLYSLPRLAECRTDSRSIAVNRLNPHEKYQPCQAVRVPVPSGPPLPTVEPSSGLEAEANYPLPIVSPSWPIRVQCFVSAIAAAKSPLRFVAVGDLPNRLFALLTCWQHFKTPDRGLPNLVYLISRPTILATLLT